MQNINNFSSTVRPIEILLVEDDDEDVMLMKKALVRDRIVNNVNRVEDGVEAMEYLRNEGKYQHSPRPDLILLDLNMPRKDGREVLKEIKQDEDLKCIPVVVLTTSHDHQDVLESYKDQANSFVSKPVNLDQFRSALNSLNQYWFSVVALPSTQPDSNSSRLPEAFEDGFYEG